MASDQNFVDFITVQIKITRAINYSLNQQLRDERLLATQQNCQQQKALLKLGFSNI